jgi:DNA-3-methyladenine glycosylase II
MQPQDVLKFDPQTLRTVGLSNQKASYILNIAAQFDHLNLTPQNLHTMPDDEVRAALLPIKGVGEWTVEMFLMFYLCRPDVFSPGDLGLQKGIAKLTDQDIVKPKAAAEFALRWQPWRTVASYYLWRSLEDPSANREPRSSD